jgi:hypothetical protein
MKQYYNKQGQALCKRCNMNKATTAQKYPPFMAMCDECEIEVELDQESFQ